MTWIFIADAMMVTFGLSGWMVAAWFYIKMDSSYERGRQEAFELREEARALSFRNYR